MSAENNSADSSMANGEVVPENENDDSIRHIEDNAPETNQDESENCKPIWFCKLLVARPVSVLAVSFGCHFLLLLLTGLLIVSGYDVLPMDFSKVPLNLEDDPAKLRSDAWQYAADSGLVSSDQSGEAGKQDKRGTTYQVLELFYEMTDSNIITRENLLATMEIEKTLYLNSVYQEKLCQLEIRKGIQSCQLPLSILRFFDGTLKNIHPNFFDPYYRNISLVLNTARSINLTKTLLAYNLGKDTVFHKNKTLVSHCYRSLFYIGWPMDGYKDNKDKQNEQADKLDQYISTAFSETLGKKYEKGVGEMNFYYGNIALRKEATQVQVVEDMRLAIFSFVFIMLFMWLQTGSLWITSWAVFSILSSFNISNLIYRIIFDYRYFGVFHVLSIFIILGIGADDVFVFTDTWKQSEKVSFPSSAHRLSFVYKRASKAMFITSFTTMVAFLSNMLSPLLAISSFGLFSAILIFVNYCSIIIFFPAVVAVHEKYRKGMCCCCILCGSVDEAVTENMTRKKMSDYVINFFQGVFFEYVITHKVVRYVVLSCFAVLIGLSVTFAAKLQPDNGQVNIWSPNTNWGKVKDLRSTGFYTSQEDKVVTVTIIWGLGNQDRSKCHHTDYKCRGRTVVDTSFDMNLPPCQKAVLNLCKKIKNLPENEVDKLKLRRDQVTGQIESECFVEKMEGYFRKESTKSMYPSNSDFSFPLNSEKMKSIMKSYPTLYNVSKLSEDYYRYFEMGLGFFLTNGTRSNYANNVGYKLYSKYFGATYDIAVSGRYDGNEVKDNQYGNRLLHIGIAFNTTLQIAKLGFSVGLAIHDNWEKFVVNEMSTMPQSCNKAFQATVMQKINVWHWLKVQKVLIKNAVRGVVTGILLALVVLIIATTNIYVGMLATFTIAMVTCGVLATITLLGWKLGVLESLNTTLVVGLSVDYVVHLAEGYIELTGSRLTRTRGTLAHVGISVISGACTTLGAAVFMLAAKIIFFKQFGIFIFCTIALSTLYSLVFFTTLLALIGPENDHGSILPALQKTKDFVRGKTKNHEDCQKCNGKGFYPKSAEQKEIDEIPAEEDIQS